jgi:hypothetical protein
MKKVELALLFLGITATIAQAIDLQELASFKLGSARFCERSGGKFEQPAPPWRYSRRTDDRYDLMVREPRVTHRHLLVGSYLL